MTCSDTAELRAEMEQGAGALLLTEEVLSASALRDLAEIFQTQLPWSDLPVIVLTQAGIAARRQMAELNLPGKLGNVMFLERPLNALSLISAMRSALRARRRQRQVRAYLAEQVGAAEREAAGLSVRVGGRGKL